MGNIADKQSTETIEVPWAWTCDRTVTCGTSKCLVGASGVMQGKAGDGRADGRTSTPSEQFGRHGFEMPNAVLSICPEPTRRRQPHLCLPIYRREMERSTARGHWPSLLLFALLSSLCVALLSLCLSRCSIVNIDRDYIEGA